jgi:UDP-N-acetylmuramoylalanine--D-glutamate ligase
MALAVGSEPDSIEQGLTEFRAGEHRLAAVAEVDQVRFVDDSKATNAHAASAALKGFEPGSVVWIAGGLAKGARFEDLIAARGAKLRAVVLIGLDNRELSEALASQAPHVPVARIEPGGGVMDRAVRQAALMAHAGDTVLLAPAAASMDQFDSYAQRGREFQQAAERLGRLGGVR